MIISNIFNFKEENNSLKDSKKPLKLSKTKIIILVIISSIITIFYIACVIKVNNILKTNTELEKSLNTLENENDILIYKINELENLSRINKIVSEDLKLVKPNKAAISIK